MNGIRLRMLASIASVVVFLSANAAAAAGPQVAFETTMGRVVVELDPERAPLSSRNFLHYVAEGHYDGTLFHRVMEGFVIQGGGLTPDRQQKPTHAPIVNEAANGLSNLTGTLAMARENAVDSATSQFFINVVDNLRLDHVDVPPEGVTVTRSGKDVFVARAEASRVFGYAVFGRVVGGMDVVERIRYVATTTVDRGGEVFENVPVEPVIIRKAVLLPPTN
ncbi:MAG: peptidylprolyl isomerase [Burkholderiaceae bacterium]